MESSKRQYLSCYFIPSFQLLAILPNFSTQFQQQHYTRTHTTHSFHHSKRNERSFTFEVTARVLPTVQRYWLKENYFWGIFFLRSLSVTLYALFVELSSHSPCPCRFSSIRHAENRNLSFSKVGILCQDALYSLSQCKKIKEECQQSSLYKNRENIILTIGIFQPCSLQYGKLTKQNPSILLFFIWNSIRYNTQLYTYAHVHSFFYLNSCFTKQWKINDTQDLIDIYFCVIFLYKQQTKTVSWCLSHSWTCEAK